MLRTIPVALAALCAPLAAQSFSYPDFSSTAQLNLLGNAVQTGNAVHLTANASNQTGWFWRQTAVPVVAGFDTTFSFRITPPPIGVKAEGMAFVVHADPNGASATGGTVWGMGYGSGANSSQGIRRSIAIELDTYQDPFLSDSSANELTIHTRGLNGNHESEVYSLGRTTLPTNFANGQPHTLRVVHTGSQLSVYYDGAATPALSVAYDLIQGGTYANGGAVAGIGSPDGTGYVGFCATTGAGTLTELVEILSWDWVSTPLTDPCYAGTLGADTLTVHGETGGFFRRVQVATYQGFDIALANPPGFGAGAPYVLFASLAPQPGAPGSVLPFGSACFPMLPMGATELVLADSFGLGPALLPAAPTPHAIQIPQGLVTFPLDLTLQAATLATPSSLGLTNAIDLSIAPSGSPVIQTVLPASAAPGVTVTISGQNFVPGCTVTLNGAPIALTSVTAEAVQFAFPAGTSCDTQLVLTNPDGAMAMATLNPTPIVTNTLLSSGASSGGAVFVVQGTGFAPGTTVTIGGAAANVLSASATAVSMYTPAGTPGMAAVVLTTPGGCTASTTYTYL